jgi:hypothetical protein
MRKFLVKLCLFLAPFIFLIFLFPFLYSDSGGDLSRLGKISFDKNYREKFKNDFGREKKYTDYNELTTKNNKVWDFFTIGDSFSGQNEYGYQNMLADEGFNVLNLNANAYNVEKYNPIDFSFKALNSKLFNKLSVKTLVLQIAEREAIHYIKNTDKESLMDNNDLKQIPLAKKKSNKLHKYLEEARLFYLYNLGYLLDKRAFSSNVYKLNLTEDLFSIKKDKLLVYYRDITSIKNNTKKHINSLNNVLNELAYKFKNANINLIVLIAPDKYDLYYKYIKDKSMPPNRFFEYLEELPKNYIYLNTKQLLTKELNNKSLDLYFADDSHWSPVASKLIINEIIKSININ